MDLCHSIVIRFSKLLALINANDINTKYLDYPIQNVIIIFFFLGDKREGGGSLMENIHLTIIQNDRMSQKKNQHQQQHHIHPHSKRENIKDLYEQQATISTFIECIRH